MYSTVLYVCMRDHWWMLKLEGLSRSLVLFILTSFTAHSRLVKRLLPINTGSYSPSTLPSHTDVLNLHAGQQPKHGQATPQTALTIIITIKSKSALQCTLDILILLYIIN